MRYLLVVMGMLLCPLTSAVAQVSFGIGLPEARIGINLPVFPRLVLVPGYPVYYAPNVGSNYFFYDGMYWIYEGDSWYASSWYNGPWALVAPDFVPVYVLRVPVRYYRHPPAYFSAWRRDAPPRWGEHFGNDWERQHSGWDRWNRRAAPRPSPLPVYQRRYSGNRYPQPERQPTLHNQNYRYQPREATVQQAYRAQGLHGTPPAFQRAPPPSPRGSMGEQPARGAQQREAARAMPAQREQPQRAQPQRAPERDRARQGKGGAPEPRGNDERRQERDR